MRIGTALHCSIKPSIFHRKNYFYPDRPKDYQISQYDQPINVDGWLDLPDGARVGIERAHLEEDTGKTTHVGAGGRIHGAEHSLVDYNRSGVPLVEIVSGPGHPLGRRGPRLRIGAALGAGGQRRVRRPYGGGLDAGRRQRVGAADGLRRSSERGARSRTSTRCALSAGRSSTRRPARSPSSSPARRVTQETRHWDEDAGRTSTMRSKEEAYDYRYFPEPDLVPVDPEPEWIAEVAKSLGPMPSDRRARLAELLGGEPTDAQVDQLRAVVDQQLDSLVVSAVGLGVPAPLALVRTANEVAGDAVKGRVLDPEAFAALLSLENAGTVSATQSKAILAELLAAGGGDPAAMARAKGFEAMSADSVTGVVAEVVAANPSEWGRYREGDDKLAQFFIGQVMKATGGKADGKAVVAELRSLRD